MATYIDEFYTDIAENEQKKEKPKESKPKRKKAKHKHIYEPVLFINSYGDNKVFYSAGSECTVCKTLVHGFPKATQKKFQEYAKDFEANYSVDLIKSFSEKENLKEVELETVAGYDFATRMITPAE